MQRGVIFRVSLEHAGTVIQQNSNALLVEVALWAVVNVDGATEMMQRCGFLVESAPVGVGASVDKQVYNLLLVGVVKAAGPFIRSIQVVGRKGSSGAQSPIQGIGRKGKPL